MTTKRFLIIAAIVVAFIIGAVVYVKYETVLNTLVALFTYSLGAVSFWYLRGLYDTHFKK